MKADVMAQNGTHFQVTQVVYNEEPFTFSCHAYSLSSPGKQLQDRCQATIQILLHSAAAAAVESDPLPYSMDNFIGCLRLS